MKKIIFHHPLPLNPNATSASGIRPLKMLEAFREMGYEIDLVVGYAKDRKQSIKKIKENIKNGIKYDFVYAESSTMPTTLTESHHLPTHPLMDWLFFRFCKKHSINIGLFYRDIYWLFDEYSKNLNPIKAFLAKIAYRFDLSVYEKTLNKLYLPSLKMVDYIPLVSDDKFAELPPAADIIDYTKNQNRVLELFYVGGLSNHYQMHKLFNLLRDYKNINFTLCTRKDEWDSMKKEYPTDISNINIVHLSGENMHNLLKQSDIAMLFVKPQEYWEFAAPVKLYEYIGFEKPIIATNGTLAGEFVKKHNIGWSLDYDEKELSNLFDSFISNGLGYDEKIENLKNIKKSNSWIARAEQVVRDLKI